ncbi:hypothetical protein V8E36_002663 [Tilletia maclaganii]
MPPPKTKAAAVDARTGAAAPKLEAATVKTEDAPVKLTKAQQKAAKFKKKDAASKKQHQDKKIKGAKHIPDGGDLPVLDDDDVKEEEEKEDEQQQRGEKLAVFGKPSRRKGRDKLKEEVEEEAKMAKKQLAAAAAGGESKKRKRGSAAEQVAAAAVQQLGTASGSTWKEEQGADAGEGAEGEDKGADGAAAPKKKKRRKSKKAGGDGTDRSRLIVFVGNMSFEVTSKQLAKHFGDTCGETPSVRMLTRKVDEASKKEASQLSASKLKSIAKGKASLPKSMTDDDPVPMGKDGKPLSKGCAFLEFTTVAALQKALRFHHTQLGGRQINVELTAGGGGTNTGRMEKIKAKNVALDVERAKLHEKYVAPGVAAQKSAVAASTAAAASSEAKAEVNAKGEGAAQWGPRGGRSSSGDGGDGGGTEAGSKAKGKKGKAAKWTPSGANATRLTV